MRITPARKVSAPTRLASNAKAPVPFTVAPVTGEPGDLATGAGSPVIIDSSTCDAPRSTTPSVGIRSPGRTSTTSPTRTSCVGTSSVSPSALDMSDARREPRERGDGSGRPTFGARFEQPAQKDERDDHAGGFVIDLSRAGGQQLRGEGRDGGKEIGAGRADRDERVHIRRAA